MLVIWKRFAGCGVWGERRSKLLGRIIWSEDKSCLISVGINKRKSKLLKIICYLGVIKGKPCGVLGKNKEVK